MGELEIGRACRWGADSRKDKHTDETPEGHFARAGVSENKRYVVEFSITPDAALRDATTR